MLVCTKDGCKQKENTQIKYIGETERTLKDRSCEHIGYINTKKYQPEWSADRLICKTPIAAWPQETEVETLQTMACLFRRLHTDN